MRLTMIAVAVLAISSMIYGIKTSNNKEVNELFYNGLGIVCLILMIYGYINSWTL